MTTDVDGICARFILYDTLTRAAEEYADKTDAARRPGLADGLSPDILIDYDVPDRIRDGFGLNVRLIDDASRDGVDTVITCDNGIAAVEAIKRAKELGMTVIITDHHEPDKDLPEAHIIVDPKMPGDSYPNKELCGAAVAWKLMYLYEAMYLLRGHNRSEQSVSGPEYCPSVEDLYSMKLPPVRE